MTISRRLFIKAASGATLIATLPQAFVNVLGQDKRKSIQGAPTGSGTLGIPVESNVDPLYYYNSSAFTSYVGSTFRVYVSQRNYFNLKLIEVTELKPEVPGKSGFSLLFQDSADNRFPGGLYKIDHAALGTLSLMLGPVGQSRNTYEAVINRQYP
jgi:hypothetical protein